ncbi:MAG: hypothetical protein B7Z10_12870 [Rhodobacterales bacterium 32-66-7]|nr:MAG: hypothetical protein B7Z10_12870 [Rhodobacterales bacterium 32-66-7]
MSVKRFLTISTAILAVMNASAVMAEGLYFGAYAGLAAQEDLDLDIPSTSDNGFVLGAVIGTDLTENLRIEGELSFETSEGQYEGKGGSTDFDVSTLSLLGNAWVDFDTGTGLQPYVGGGVGVARVAVDDGISDDSDTGFAYQVGFGARFGQSGEFDLGYRYRGVSAEIDGFTSDEIDYNSHMLQFRWTGRF